MKPFHLFAIALMALALSACGTKSDPGKPAMLKEDKFLNCEELQLEMNDAQFLLEQAKKNRGLNFKNIVWPVGYPQTYSSAEEAIDMTTTRLNYLRNIYTIKKCDMTYSNKGSY